LIELIKENNSGYYTSGLITDLFPTERHNVEKKYSNGDRSHLIIKSILDNYEYEIKKDKYNVETLIEYKKNIKFKNQLKFKKLYYIESIGNYKVKNRKYYYVSDILFISNLLKEFTKQVIIIKEINWAKQLFNKPNEDYVLYDKWVLRNIKLATSISSVANTLLHTNFSFEFWDQPYNSVPTETILIPTDLRIKY